MSHGKYTLDTDLGMTLSIKYVFYYVEDVHEKGNIFDTELDAEQLPMNI